jgi:hypothetical protein
MSRLPAISINLNNENLSPWFYDHNSNPTMPSNVASVRDYMTLQTKAKPPLLGYCSIHMNPMT